MGKITRWAAGGVLGLGCLLAAQPAMADMVNLICRYRYDDSGFSDISVIWTDSEASKVFVVFSLQERPGTSESNKPLNGGANVEDALRNVTRGWLKEWPATITSTSIKWTADLGTPQPIEINRLTGVLTWSSPQDPTPPNHGTAQCEKGDVPFPAAKF